MSSFHNHSSQSSGRKNKNNDLSHLLNFRTAGPPPSSNQSYGQNKGKSKQHHNSKKKSKKQQQETWEETRARKSLSGFFFLHSSSSHGFVLTRRSLVSDSVICSPSTAHNYGGPDVGVRWEAVRIVKCLIPNNALRNDSKTGFGLETAAVTNLLDSMAICPICLDEFVAPRITKCGHAFCLSCILRHLHSNLEDGTQKKIRSASKCPCCAEEIHSDQLRPIIFHTVQPPQTNRVMSFTRLHRVKGCHSPFLPQANGLKRVEKFSAPNSNEIDSKFSRFNYVHSEMLLEHLGNELTLLQRIVNGHGNGFPMSDVEKGFFHMAIEVVKFQQQKTARESEEELNLMASEMKSRLKHPIHSIKNEALKNLTKETERKVGNERTMDDSEINAHTIATPNEEIDLKSSIIDTIDKSPGRSSNRKKNRRARSKSLGEGSNNSNILGESKDLVYLDANSSQFYQASDGQLCFLSKLNMKCLEYEFAMHNPMDVQCSSVKNLPFPDLIEGQVIETETLHLTPESRKRMSFLSHLPLYTDIQFVEINLNRILSEETKAKFRNEIEKRRKMRKNKANLEKKADRKAKKKEEDRINALKAAHPMIDPDDEFFHSPAAFSHERVSSEDIPPSILDEAFGPALQGNSTTNSSGLSQASNPNENPSNLSQSSSPQVPKAPVISFRNACVHNTPSTPSPRKKSAPLNTSTDFFPPLSSTPLKTSTVVKTNNKAKTSWGSISNSSSSMRQQSDQKIASPIIPMKTLQLSEKVSKGSHKGKKVLLFSTGGHRGR